MGGRLRPAARPSETTRLSSASVNSPISAEENQTSELQKTPFEREGGQRRPLYFMAESPAPPTWSREATEQEHSRRVRAGGDASRQGAAWMPASAERHEPGAAASTGRAHVCNRF